MNTPPEQPANSFRITLSVEHRCRLDGPLLEYLRSQEQVQALKGITRGAFKDLFKQKKVQIKGQNALPSSILAVGTTYVDILGYSA